jgi:hypothetical protein
MGYDSSAFPDPRNAPRQKCERAIEAYAAKSAIRTPWRFSRARRLLWRGKVVQQAEA